MRCTVPAPPGTVNGEPCRAKRNPADPFSGDHAETDFAAAGIAINLPHPLPNPSPEAGRGARFRNKKAPLPLAGEGFGWGSVTRRYS